LTRPETYQGLIEQPAGLVLVGTGQEAGSAGASLKAGATRVKLVDRRGEV
jgi:hypothetical protein